MEKENLKALKIQNHDLQILLNHGCGNFRDEKGEYQYIDIRQNNRLILQDILFNGDYNLRIGETRLPIVFINCHFENNVLLNSFARHSDQFKFENCFVDKEIHFQGDLGDIEFKNCPNLNSIIVSAESGIKSLSIENSIFNRLTVLSQNVDLDLRVASTEIRELFECKIRASNFLISGGSFNKISLENCIFHNGIEINKSAKINELSFDKCLFRKLIAYKGCNINRIRNKNTRETYSISAFKSELCDIEIELDKIEFAIISIHGKSNLYLAGNLLEEKNFIILDSDVSSINLSKAKIQGSMEFSNVSINSNGMLSFYDSNLGKTKILNCRFENGKFEFKNSEISEIFIADTDFPKDVVLDNKINRVQARLAFGQLQKIFERQGDSIRHYEYQAREVESYFKTIGFFVPKFPWINFSKLNLLLNYVSNNFGRHWAQGIVFTFVIAFVFFNLTINSTDNFNFTFNLNTTMVGSFFKFINPIRHFEIETLFSGDMNNSNFRVNSMTYFWDFLGRIFVAYGYYQTIQAFRRYGRK